MRVLWIVRADLKTQPGGDTTQIAETAAALERLGISIELSSSPSTDMRDFDLVHLFHLDRVWENAHWCQVVRDSGTPSVLSPIYWPTREFDLRGRGFASRIIETVSGPGTYNHLKLWYHTARQSWRLARMKTNRLEFLTVDRARRFILESVRALLPNSMAELHQIETHYGATARAFIVPNAVNPKLFPPPSLLPSRPVSNPSILCVGRIEPRKNQYRLIQSLRGSGLPLRIIGQASPFSAAYARQCRQAAGRDVSFHPWQPTGKLQSFYQSATVHVSPSWYETPGLASLEAAASGCQVVVTEGGATREYFGDDAEYCQPDDPDSILQAIQHALDRPTKVALPHRIARDFSWDQAGLSTKRAYEYTLESSPA